jgi:hypothetical protein
MVEVEDWQPSTSPGSGRWAMKLESEIGGESLMVKLVKSLSETNPA